MIENSPIENSCVFKCAVFYPGGWERYGGVHVFNTEKQARQNRDELLSMGYKHVHIWRVSTTLVAGDGE